MRFFEFAVNLFTLKGSGNGDGVTTEGHPYKFIYWRGI